MPRGRWRGEGRVARLAQQFATNMNLEETIQRTPLDQRGVTASRDNRRREAPQSSGQGTDPVLATGAGTPRGPSSSGRVVQRWMDSQSEPIWSVRKPLRDWVDRRTGDVPGVRYMKVLIACLPAYTEAYPNGRKVCSYSRGAILGPIRDAKDIPPFVTAMFYGPGEEQLWE